MEKILVTGGAGFIGSNACNILSKKGYKVIAFDNLSLGKKENLDSGVEFIQGSITNKKDLEAVGDVDYIIHLAAASSSPMFLEHLVDSYTTNLIGHLEVLEFARAHKVKKVLFASSSSVYGNGATPLSEDQKVLLPNFYSASKYAQEEVSEVYNRQYGLEIIAFRFMSIYGPHEEHKGRFGNLVSQFIWGMEQGKEPVIYGDGSQTRDFTNAADLAQAFLLAIQTPKRFGFTAFNIGTGMATVVKELIPIINKKLGTDIKAKFISNPIAPGSYIEGQLADLTKISRELGYKPTVTLEEGIAQIIELRAKNPIAPRSLSY